MTGKTALVTGANGGLGTQVTKALLDSGFNVVGLAPRIRQSDFDPPNFTAVPASLDSLDAAKKAADSVIARFGRIDVLAHLVGGFAGGQTVADTDDATFQRMFDMNVNSAFHILRAVLPHMRKASGGRIIAIGSPDALKHTALGGELLLLECDALGPTLAALRQAPGVIDASVFGNSLHVLVGDAERSLAELPAYLAAKALRPSRVERIHPSLEDVFVQLIAVDRAERRQAA